MRVRQEARCLSSWCLSEQLAGFHSDVWVCFLQAEGYAEGDYTLYHRFTLMEFVKAQNPVEFLDKASEITFDNPELENHSATTLEIRECCKDVRVLGRKELRLLLNWRNKLRRHLAKKLKEQAKELDGDISLSSEDESDGEKKDVRRPPEQREEEGEGAEDQEQVEHALAALKAEEVAELKRKKRKVLKERRKQRERIELKMDLPGVSIVDDAEVCLFSLKTINRSKLKEIEQGDMKVADEALEEGALDQDGINLSDQEINDDVSLASDLDSSDLEDVKQREQQMDRKKKLQRKRSKRPEPEGQGTRPEEQDNPLLVELEDRHVREERQADLWFGKDIFAGLDVEADEALEIKQTKKLYTQQGCLLAGEEDAKRRGEEQLTGGKEETAEVPEDSEQESSSDESDIQQMKHAGSQGNKRTADESDTFQVVPVDKAMKKARVLDPEGLALGASIAASKKRARELVDDSFNRYAFDEELDELPDWFAENDQKYRRRPVPFDRAMADEFRQRWKEINARPIKKIAEAKARKKRRQLKKMEQTRKKAEAVVNTVDISEREKISQMKSIYKKAGIKEKREVTYIVAKKGTGRKVRRPAGVKGQFRVVDARMKKDMRKMPKGGQTKGKGRRK
ncbi:pre-rRNA 2'-O-ribose RNA methyltransferase FTSJ3 [Heterodontus francisci]|uniref:pre-rRNA 2'-O-ribose RNA methyltransferase FTSJ3 n=1 Tax=Heterodontus francisci TaxID=7792 RepID=UPI00355B553A